MNSNSEIRQEPVLTLKNVSYSYHTLSGETKALENISFDVYPGEFIAIVGPSGCGNALVLLWKTLFVMNSNISIADYDFIDFFLQIISLFINIFLLFF